MSIWKKTPDIAALAELSAGCADDVLGITVVEIGEDFVRGEMPITKRTQQIFGLLHGGVSCVLAETLGSIGANLACDDDHYAVGVDINATHLNGIRGGKVIGIATPLKLGRRLQTWAIDIESDDGRPICSARLTTAVLSSAPQ
ncbi:hotdog fold thioesterase [Mangrovimicrobium sediminis]|uniref:Hotdog fold thioesterase n=1 Tax=Mangrovimicrobium sediminis TaxID=2562682 RepID=A0A4Z0LYD4_9GAMM|nr:hotdog fold thioesterase [Haliea sp. SAOS-164]TGD72234.1 hotdog fold thioesterase [Haliea sp. SAOS-164]